MDSLTLEGLLGLLYVYIPRVILFFVVLFAGFILAGWARRAVARGLTRTNFDPTLTKFFSGAARILVLVLTVIALLGYLGIGTASFAAVIGAAGLAIGLALQGTLSNFAAGVMLLAFRPFKVGDVVKISGETGKVDEIDLFVTKIDTFDNRRIILPNGQVFGNTIENITFHPIRRADVPVGTDYGTPTPDVRAVLERVAASVEGALPEPEPQIVLTNLGESSIDWEVRVWCPTPDFLAVRQRTVRDVKRALDEAGISIPFPQRDVHLDGMLDR